ncbi:leucine-rich repeat and guanylate kinase domain-containing protein-like, partial [Scleropages formosus]
YRSADEEEEEEEMEVEDKERNEGERWDGKLTEEEARKCLFNLGRSARGLEHAYLCLSVPGRDLRDVSILCSYIYLQKLELPFNKIKDLSCVSHMPYLITLDASHNEITDFFGFEPPKNLKEVNFSHNRMSAMKDLSAYPSLRRLHLDHNDFHEIRGLENCVSLTYLSLAHNRISSIEGLGDVPLKEISLRGNQIQRIENVRQLRTLQSFDLAFNKIRSLSGLENLDLLGTIDLEGNQRLTSLDQREVTVEEKVSAVNKYDPPVEVTAARDHMTHLVYQLTQPQVLFDSTLPSLDTPYPMLVLTGPQACGKRELAHKLCRDFCDFFAYGACHTTRSPYFGEVDRCDYHFVSEEDFQHMTRSGKFIETLRYGGHLYGLSREAIEGAARDGLACCVHMELEGVYSLKNTYLEPRYVLLVPTDSEAYARRMRQRGLYSPSQIDAAVGRVDFYVHVHRERPGFFDNTIPCDDLEEAYRALSQVVREYLGLEEQAGRGGVSATPDTTRSGDSLVAFWAKTPSEQHNRMPMRLAPQRSPAETASIQRRQQRAQEALTGRSPGVFSQLFLRCRSLHAPAQDKAAAAGLALQHATAERAMHRLPIGGAVEPPLSACRHAMLLNRVLDSCGSGGGSLTVDVQTSSVALQHPSEDSPRESRASSGPSTRSSAWLCSPADSAGNSDAGEGMRAVPPLGEELKGVGVDSGDTPGTGTLTGRPGSDAKPVLPPIPSGRRTNEQPSPC